jgi:BirA family biotin operon repressor/biotin-[acetyl-CoA-carboxylase] ligase
LKTGQPDILNPFGAPVYYRETISSTMDTSRDLALRGEPHGTVITADFQEAGRGRVRGRSWQAEAGKNLFFTILLRYPDFSRIPEALSLKTGLAVSLAIEDFAPALAGSVSVKWPNDVMICSREGGDARKVAGILTEGAGGTMYIGVGVNVAQTEFPEDLRAKATSIALALRAPVSGGCPLLLECILSRLHREISPLDGEAAGGMAADSSIEGPAGEGWRRRLEERLYLRGRRVRFISGAAGSDAVVEGRLLGISPGGALLIQDDGGESRSFISGELDVYG